MRLIVARTGVSPAGSWVRSGRDLGPATPGSADHVEPSHLDVELRGEVILTPNDARNCDG